MRKTVLMVVGAAALLFAAALGDRAGAMPIAAPAVIGGAVAEGGLVRKAAVVCGYYGCVRTYPRYYGPPYGYYGAPYGYYARPYGYYARPYGYYARPYGYRW